MFNKKSYVSLAAAIALGSAAAWLAQSWMQSRVDAQLKQPGEASVVVAARDIGFGDRIEAQHVRLQSWPGDSEPAGSTHNIDEVVSHFANQNIVAGEPVLKTRITDYLSGSSLAAQIAPDRRAVSVRVNDVIGVAGFLLPGNRVDVLATRMLDQKKAETTTILQDIKVLAVDQTAAVDKDKPVVVRAVTLEVDPAQAQELVRATEEGTVQLALRNPETHGAVALEKTRAPAPASVTIAPAPQQVAVTQVPEVPQVAPTPAPSKTKPAKAPVVRPQPSEPKVTVIRQTQTGQSPLAFE